MGFPFAKMVVDNKSRNRWLRPRNVLIEFNVDERPLVCERCRYSQMPSPSLVDSREPNGHHFPLFAGMNRTPAVFKYAVVRAAGGEIAGLILWRLSPTGCNRPAK